MENYVTLQGRGGIVDIATNDKIGIRIEFWGDDIDSIREFNIETQRSIKTIEKVTIYPAHEYVLERNIEEICKKIEEKYKNKSAIQEDIEQIQEGNHISKIDKYFDCFYENQETILDYLNSNYVIFIDEINKIRTRSKNIKEDRKVLENALTEKEKQIPEAIINELNIEEIEEADLKIGEEATLEEQRKIIVNSEKIAENLQNANSLIEDGGIDNISMAIRALEKIENIDEKYGTVATNLKNLYYELQEISRDISSYKDDTDFNEEERENIEERLEQIRFLKRKYGNSIKEIIKYKQELEQEIYRIENLEEYTNKLKQELKQVENNLNLYASQMHEIRNKKAIELSENINLNLKELEMKNATINVKVEYKANEYFGVLSAFYKVMDICVSHIPASDVKGVKEIIDCSCMSQFFNIESLCRDVGVSHAHLLRLFKKEYGLTLINYVIKKRVMYACELLETTDLSVTAVALSCGFSDILHFMKIFKRETGTTALEYRNKHK